MLTKQVIQEKLNTLIGEKVESGSQYQVYKTLLDLFKEQGIDTSKITWDWNKQRIWINHKGYRILFIDWKKSKGEYHHTWLGGSYYDWTYKGFEISLYENDSIESAIQEANEENNRRILDKQQKIERNSEQFKKIQQLFGLTHNETRTLINELHDNYYNYYHTLEEEK